MIPLTPKHLRFIRLDDHLSITNYSGASHLRFHRDLDVRHSEISHDSDANH